MRRDLLEKYFANLRCDEEEECKDVIQFLTDHLSAYPSNAVAHNNRAVVYGEIGQYELALADFKEAIRLAPHDAEPVTFRGLLYEKMGQRSLALADFDFAVNLAPNDPYYLRIRGHARFAAGDSSGAQEDFDQATRLDRFS
jgi:tetratricopeptide (TPR) repeat protein